MSKYRDPDPEIVQIIAAQISVILEEALEKKEAMSNLKLVHAVCHLYENRDFLRKEAGLLLAPEAAKKDLEVQIICDKIDKLRQFAWNGDTDPHNGIRLAEASAPFFREYGVKIKKILKDAA